MDTEGRPILMSLYVTNAYEADFVLATLLDPGTTESQSETGTSQSSASKNYTGGTVPTTGQMSGISSSTMMASSQLSVGLRTPPNPNKRTMDQMSNLPTSKRIRANEDGYDEEEEEEMLWAKDLQTNVINDNDDSDVPESQRSK
eukprot:TRINITY_DN5145_c0_g1_i2.p1 TRINITY_DN5145_c0_g1~~TRINITY_DN5145_c0_g1_i2.p1  ORF type:complete len:144 (+),score=36.04 TRINITY_DN5145_c0_g1_i2:863-1294(+)